MNGADWAAAMDTPAQAVICYMTQPQSRTGQARLGNAAWRLPERAQKRAPELRRLQDTNWKWDFEFLAGIAGAARWIF